MYWFEIVFKRFLPAFVVTIFAAGLATYVMRFSRPAGVFLDAAFLSGGILLLVEAVFLRRLRLAAIQEPTPEAVATARFGGALLLGAIMGLLLLLLLGSQRPSPPPPDHTQSLLQVLGKTESDLKECLTSKASEKEGKSSDGAAGAQMEEVVRRLDDLKATLSRSQNTPLQNETSSWKTVLIVLLALGAAAGIIWLTLRFAPSETPLAIAFCLAGAMIKAAEHLPPPGENKYYWWVVFFLLSAGLAIIVFGRWVREPAISADGSAASNPPPQPTEESKSGWFRSLFRKRASRSEANSPLIIGFSLMLLASTLAYLGKAPEKLVPEQSSLPVITCPACPSISSMKFKKALQPVQGFRTGPDAAETQNLEPFKRELESINFTEADLLLLLGSTDCIPVKKNASKWHSNQELAQARADTVRNAANKLGLPGPPTIINAMVIGALPQAESCGKALERRAVYPLLFRPQPSK